MGRAASARKKRASSESTALPAARGAVAPPPRPPRGARLWAFRLITLSLAPVLLALAEGTLRVAGFGHPTAFIVRDDVSGTPVYRDNPHFTRRFFPPPLHRPPRPFTAARAKP